MDLLVKKLLNISIHVLPIIDKHLIHLTIAVVSSWTSYNPNFLSVYLQNNKDFFFLMSSHLNSLHTKKKKIWGVFWTLTIILIIHRRIVFMYTHKWLKLSQIVENQHLHFSCMQWREIKGIWTSEHQITLWIYVS